MALAKPNIIMFGFFFPSRAKILIEKNLVNRRNMLEQQTIAVQEGIWLPKSLLEKAGLGSRLQVAIEAGEIRIITAPPDESEIKKQEIKNGQTTDDDFDLFQSPLWELCGAFEVTNPPEEDIVERKETAEIVTNYAERVDKIIYGGS